jgi:Ulp1 family protease
MLQRSRDDADRRELVADLGLMDASMILAPINNNTTVERAGGSHWSLLLVERKDGKCRAAHADSGGGMNRAAANTLWKHLAPVLEPSASPVPPVEQLVVPQQRNAYDCGPFTCVFAEQAVVHRTIDLASLPPSSMDQAAASKKRADILALSASLFS